MKVFLKLRLGLGAAALAGVTLIPTAHSGDDISCNIYADTAVIQNQQQAKNNCGLQPPVWSDDRASHYDWCMRVSSADAETGNQMRVNGLMSCLPRGEIVFGQNRDCTVYAIQAINQEKENADNGCGLKGPEWSADPFYHYNWCVRADMDRANAGADLRRRALAACSVPASEKVTINAVRDKQITLSRSAYAFGTETLSLDKDHDGLVDHAENVIAEAFAPYLIFDSDERFRPNGYPITLFQVIPKSDAPDQPELRLRYALLFQGDTYGPSAGYGCTWGSGSHNGDVETMTFTVTGDAAGTVWTLTEVALAPWRPGPKWPGTNVQIANRTHPSVYLSASKHHQYLDTSHDDEDSSYSDPPLFFDECNDDVNGQGAKFVADVKSLGDQSAYGYNNVGEVADHDDTFFVDSLDEFFPGQNVWSGKRFYESAVLKDVFYKPDLREPAYVPPPKPPSQMEGEAVIITPDNPQVSLKIATPLPGAVVASGPVRQIKPGEVFALGDTAILDARMGQLTNGRLPVMVSYRLDLSSFQDRMMTAGVWLLDKDNEVIGSVGYVPTFIDTAGDGEVTVPVVLDGKAVSVSGLRAMINRKNETIVTKDIAVSFTVSGE